MSHSLNARSNSFVPNIDNYFKPTNFEENNLIANRVTNQPTNVIQEKSIGKTKVVLKKPKNQMRIQIGMGFLFVVALILLFV